MKEKHLIALDLDGTLLKGDQTISDKSKKVLRAAQDDGHIVMISTGRPYRSSMTYYEQLGLNTPMVNFNGAFVHHPLDKSWGTFHTPLDLTVAKDIVDALYTFSFHNIIAEIVDDVYIHYHDKKLLELFSVGALNIASGDLRNSLATSPTSMLIHTDEEHVQTIQTHLSDVHAEVIDHRNWSAPWHVIEIVKSGANKAVGVKRVADYFGIPKDRIIAFGDENNDIEMLDYAGTGVAMANAIDQAKTVAKATTLSNEEDGVAVYLQEHFNIKL